MQVKRTGTECVSITLSELLQLSKNARQLSLSALRVRSAQSGQHLSRLLGRGMEFAESRRYQPGDDIRAIDWRVTARTGKPHSKLFTAEKERQVLLCADMRSSMFFATQGVFKSVQAALLLGYITWAAVQTGNRLGGLIFDNENQFEFRPAMGKRGALPFLQRLAESATFPNKNREPSSIPTMEHAITTIKRLATPGCMLFVISDFRHLSPYARDLLTQISAHSDLNLCFLYDPFETALPKNGIYPVTNGDKELQLHTHNKKIIAQYQEQFIERKTQISSLSHHRHIHFMECSTEQDPFEQLKENFS